MILSAVEVLGSGSLTHINSVIFDEEAAYVNSWSLGQAYKVDLETGDLIWTLGEGGDFAADGAADTPWFSHAHSIEMVPEKEGSFLFYDNGPRSRGVSRVVEYTLDEQTMDAEITWEYPGDIAQDRWFNEAWGDVDPLENSNILVTAGNATMGDTQSRLFEVTREGMVVWEVVWGVNDGGDPMGSYAAERIPAVAVEL